MAEEVLNVLKGLQRNTEQGFERLEKKLDAHHNAFLSFADAVSQRFDRLESEYSVTLDA